MATLPVRENLLSGLLADAEYIHIDHTPEKDGNGTHRIHVEVLFDCYKRWLSSIDGDDALPKTLRCANLFEEELHALDALRRKGELPWIPYLGLLSDDMLEDDVTWVLGVRAVTVEDTKATRVTSVTQGPPMAQVREDVQIAAWWAVAMLAVAAVIAMLAAASGSTPT